MDIKTKHFERASREHTDRVIEVVRDFLDNNPQTEHIVVATTEGTTGLAFAKAFQEKDVIVVAHHTGFREDNYNELSDEKRQEIKSHGASVLITTHAFAGVSRGIRNTLGTWTATELMAIAYRTFCQGTKVCAEIAMMTADAGLVPVDKDVVCVGGTGRGADTAWLVRPANTNHFPNLKMKACLCKPIEF